MQSWSVRSCGVCGRVRAREVRRRADHRHAHVRTDAHRDHVFGHLLAETNAGVVALGDDVGQAVVDDDLDLDVRVVAAAACAIAGHRTASAGMLAGRDADRAGGFFAQFAQRGEFGVDLVEPRADRAQQPLARLGRRDAARRAGQQPNAEPLLERRGSCG